MDYGHQKAALAWMAYRETVWDEPNGGALLDDMVLRNLWQIQSLHLIFDNIGE